MCALRMQPQLMPAAEVVDTALQNRRGTDEAQMAQAASRPRGSVRTGTDISSITTVRQRLEQQVHSDSLFRSMRAFAMLRMHSGAVGPVPLPGPPVWTRRPRDFEMTLKSSACFPPKGFRSSRFAPSNSAESLTSVGSPLRCRTRFRSAAQMRFVVNRSL
jgi:hypothetical protein